MTDAQKITITKVFDVLGIPLVLFLGILYFLFKLPFVSFYIVIGTVIILEGIWMIYSKTALNYYGGFRIRIKEDIDKHIIKGNGAVVFGFLYVFLGILLIIFRNYLTF